MATTAERRETRRGVLVQLPSASIRGCRGHQMTRGRPVVVFDGSSIWVRCSLLWLLLFALPVNHVPISDVHGVGPVHCVCLLVLAAITGELPSIRNTLVDFAVLDLLPFHSAAVNHYTPTSTDSSPEPGLVLKRNVFWRRGETYPRASPWLILFVHTIYGHCISASFIRNRSWWCGQLRLREDRTEV